MFIVSLPEMNLVGQTIVFVLEIPKILNVGFLGEMVYNSSDSFLHVNLSCRRKSVKLSVEGS